MNADTLLRDEIQRLYTLESGLVAAFDRLDGRVGCRKLAVSLIMLIEAADRHLIDLERICVEEGWPLPQGESPMVRAWWSEVEGTALRSHPCSTSDAICLSLLRRAVHLRIPCYETARLMAFYAERPLIARTLRLALEDEHASLDRLRSAANVGVSLRAVLGGPFTSS